MMIDGKPENDADRITDRLLYRLCYMTGAHEPACTKEFALQVRICFKLCPVGTK